MYGIIQFRVDYYSNCHYIKPLKCHFVQFREPYQIDLQLPVRTRTRTFNFKVLNTTCTCTENLFNGSRIMHGHMSHDRSNENKVK